MILNLTPRPPPALTVIDPVSDEEHASIGVRLRPRPTGPGWIAHAGLGRHRPGGAPSAATLADAVRLRVDRIELDVVATPDGELLARHDARMPSGIRIADMCERHLRRLCPGVLALDEAVELVGGRVPLLLDIKSDAAVLPLAGWLSRRSDPEQFAVCSESAPALLTVRSRAPRVARWPSLPDLGIDPAWYRWVLAAAWNHRTPAGAAGLALTVGRGVAALPRQRAQGLARISGAPWERQLPRMMQALVGRVGASALCVHHYLTTPEVVDTAHRLGVATVAWTINHGDAVRRVIASGIDLVTTDDVSGMRHAAM